MPRPCKPDTKQFLRPLSDAQRAILLAAGAGDITRGWHELLDVYAHLYAQGFRPGMMPDRIRFLMNEHVKESV